MTLVGASWGSNVAKDTVYTVASFSLALLIIIIVLAAVGGTYLAVKGPDTTTTTSSDTTTATTTATGTDTATGTGTRPNNWTPAVDVDFGTTPDARARFLDSYRTDNCTQTNGRSDYAAGVADMDNLLTVDSGELVIKVGALSGSCSNNWCSGGSGTPCRASLRFESKDEYGAGTLFVMRGKVPTACGTWPAYWTTVRNGWPVGGEIDIVETAGPLDVIHSTLHTGPAPPSCFIDYSRMPDGYAPGPQQNCYSDPSAINYGCGVSFPRNTQQGVYAMWMDIVAGAEDPGIKMFFWSYDTNVATLQQPGGPLHANPDPASWNEQLYAFFRVGEAEGAWQGCPASTFGRQVNVINTELAGGFPDAFWNASGCSAEGTVTESVQNMDPNDPGTMWRFSHLRILTSET